MSEINSTNTALSNRKSVALSVRKQFNSYFFPTLLMAMALPVSTLIMNIFVGNVLGAQSYTAQAVCMPLTQIFAVVYFTAGVGGSTLVAIALGEKNNAQANRVFSTAMAFLLVFSIALAVLILVFLDPITHLLVGGNQQLLPLVQEYTKPLILATPLLVVLGGLGYFIRTDNMPRLASLLMIVSNVLAIPMAIVYIQIFHLGIAGASLGTLTGYFAGFLIVPVYFLSSKRKLKLTLPKPRLLGKILSTGVGVGISATLISVKMIFMNNIVVTAGGANALVAYSVAGSCFMLISLIITGVSQSTVPILGMLYGEKNYLGMRELMKYAYKFLFTLTITVVVFLEVFPDAFAHFFGVKTVEQLAINQLSLRVIALSFIGTAFAFMYIYYCQTIGKSMYGTIISVVEGVIVLIPVAELFAHFFSLSTLWFAYWIVDIVLVIVVFFASKSIAKQSNGVFSGFLALPSQQSIE
jgi:Na+-driven multidrug efflux pump